MNEESNISQLNITPGCCVCRSFSMTLESDGRVYVEGKREFPVSESERWVNIVRISGGTDHVIGLCSDGTVVSFGDNTYHQCETSHWKNIKYLQACDCMSLGVDENDELMIAGDAGHSEENTYTLFKEKELGKEVSVVNAVQGPAGNKSADLFDWKIKESGAVITGYKGSSATVVIPERLNNYNVVEIGLRAFENNTEIENVILPTTLESIGSFSFKGCIRLKNIIVPGSVTKFDNGAFWNCPMLTVFCPTDSAAAVHCRINNISHCNSYVSRYVYIENKISSLEVNDYIRDVNDVPKKMIGILSMYAYNKIYKLYNYSDIDIRELDSYSCQLIHSGRHPMDRDNHDIVNVLLFYFKGKVLNKSEKKEHDVYNFVSFPNIYLDKQGIVHYDLDSIYTVSDSFDCYGIDVNGYSSVESLNTRVDDYINEIRSKTEVSGNSISEFGTDYYKKYKPEHVKLIEKRDNLARKLSDSGMTNKFLVDLIADAQCNLDKISLIYKLGSKRFTEYQQPDMKTFRRIYDYFSSFNELKKKPVYSPKESTKETFRQQKVCSFEDEFFGYPEKLNYRLIKGQGLSLFPLSGTCGYCSSANMLTIAGDPVMNEDRIISEALNGSEATIKCLGLYNPYSENRGASCSQTIAEILERMGCPASFCPMEYDRKKTMKSYYDIISSGHIMIIFVEAGKFWQENIFGGHAITLLSVSKDGKRYVYNDTGYKGGRIDVVSADHIARCLLTMPAVYSRDVLI